jgi:glycosyltransferase involved in cell wall biosynthesis
MNILLINHYAGSIQHGMEYRPYYFSREWAMQGHSVSIAAASFSHVRSTQPTIQGSMNEEMIDSIRYLWFKTPYYSGNGAARAINIFSFVIQLLLHKAWIAQAIKPEIVIASSTYPLDIVAAKAIAYQSNARVVFEVHDLWPLSPIELGGMSRHHPFIILMQWAENLAYRTADIVISMLPKTMEHMVQHGMKPEKFAYIPNGVDVSEWEEEPGPLPNAHGEIISIAKSKGHFLVGYAGAHGLANVLDHFIDAACQLQEHPVTFVLVGQGPEKDKLRQKAQSRKQINVIFLPPVEKKIIPAILHKMDVLYIGLKGDPLFRFGVSPNKLMDYLMAEKPVIYAIRAGNDMVADSGCGISIPPENPAEIVKAVLHLMSLPEKERVEMGHRGKAYILANHDYQVLARQFVTTLEK